MSPHDEIRPEGPALTDLSGDTPMTHEAALFVLSLQRDGRTGDEECGKGQRRPRATGLHDGSPPSRVMSGECQSYSQWDLSSDDSMAAYKTPFFIEHMHGASLTFRNTGFLTI